jgi:hypothetical protein
MRTVRATRCPGFDEIATGEAEGAGPRMMLAPLRSAMLGLRTRSASVCRRLG